MEVTRVPVEFSVSVADLEKQMLRSIIQKIDPKAKPELPIVVKGNARDLRMKAPDKLAAKDAKDAPKLEAMEPEPARPRPKIVVLPAPVQPGVQPAMPPEMLPGRPRLLARPLGSRIVERAVLRPALAELVERFAELPNLDYRIELRSFDLAISGQTLTCEIGGGFRSEAKDPPALPGQPPLPPPNVRDITIKLDGHEGTRLERIGQARTEGRHEPGLDRPRCADRRLPPARHRPRHSIERLADSAQ